MATGSIHMSAFRSSCSHLLDYRARRRLSLHDNRFLRGTLCGDGTVQSILGIMVFSTLGFAIFGRFHRGWFLGVGAVLTAVFDYRFDIFSGDF